MAVIAVDLSKKHIVTIAGFKYSAIEHLKENASKYQHFFLSMLDIKKNSICTAALILWFVLFRDSGFRND
jgi:uncharacterized membrane protein